MATAAAYDMTISSEDEDIRKSSHLREALLTPIAKSYSTDIGVDVTSTGVQIFGGMGYVEETGAAQHYRDSRIAPIYEGTNGIQAMDLVGRKIRRDGGEAMAQMIADLKSYAELSKSYENGITEALESGIENLETATRVILEADEMDVLAVASNYLELAGHVISGGLLIKAACKGLEANDPLAPQMMSLARYHAQVVLPESAAHLNFIKAGASTLFEFPVDSLADL